MKGNEHILRRFTDRVDLVGESMPGQPVVEIAGDRRVLIENYFSITEYSPYKIGIRVKYGKVLICGCGMELRRMTREQLVITGRIDAVSVQRR